MENIIKKITKKVKSKLLLRKLDKCLLAENVASCFQYIYANDEKFKATLLEIIPEIDACMKQEQHTPWHVYDVWNHTLHSIEEMNGQTKNLDEKTRKLLAYVMFFHDIGKPATVGRRMVKDYEYWDTFHGHEQVSAEIARRVCKDFGFPEQEIAIIEKLILEHDIFLSVKDSENPPEENDDWIQLTPEWIEEKVEELNAYGNGETLFSYLLLIGKADNLAQNQQLSIQNIKVEEKVMQMFVEIKKKKQEEILAEKAREEAERAKLEAEAQQLSQTSEQSESGQAENETAQPAEQPTETPAEEQTETSAQQPVESPAEQPAQSENAQTNQ